MRLERILAAILIMVLSIAPALAANCASACHHGKPVMAEMSAMDSMTDCQPAHQPTPENKHTQHDHCSKAGCHASAAAAFLPAASQLFFDPPGSAHPGLVAAAISADLSPPIKPPA